MHRILSATAALLALHVTAAVANPVTVSATATTSGFTVTEPGEGYLSSSFYETGPRQNVVSTLRDEVYVFGDQKYVFHYTDTSYDVAGYTQDYYNLSLSTTRSASTSYLTYSAKIRFDPNEVQLVSNNGWLSANVSGTYIATPSPVLPGVNVLPAAATFYMGLNGEPLELEHTST